MQERALLLVTGDSAQLSTTVVVQLVLHRGQLLTMAALTVLLSATNHSVADLIVLQIRLVQALSGRTLRGTHRYQRLMDAHS